MQLHEDAIATVLIGVLEELQHELSRLRDTLAGRDESYVDSRVTVGANPADVLLAQTQSLPRGRYKVVVDVVAVNAADVGNVELRMGSGRRVLRGLGAQQRAPLEFIQSMDGTVPLELHATAATAGTIVAVLIATRLESRTH
ncbi:MAG TPA: hypothetical protein VIM33_04920 [Gaiellaceae bacterium]|jgi:hypothetical protein